MCSVTRPSSLQNVFIMQLKRNVSTSSTLQNVFSVSYAGIDWQDTALQNRPGVTGTGSVSSPSSAELRFTIAKDNVACPGDNNVGYVCTMFGQLSTALDGATTGEQTTDAVFVTVTAKPTTINQPSVRIVGESSITALRQFSVGTALELTCTGQIGSDLYNPSPSIRWCAKTATANIFTGVPIQPTESPASQSGCQYTRSSSFVYNLTSSDTYTQFLCESGYSSSCESGTAIQYVNISIERQQLPASTVMPTTDRVVAFYAYMSRSLHNVMPNQDLKFDTVISNIGNCYHPSKGIFEPNVSGFYVFTWTLYVSSFHSHFGTELVVNNGVVGSLYVTTANDQETGSTTVVAYVSSGSYVFVRTHSRYSTVGFIDSNQYSRTSFAGWKL